MMRSALKPNAMMGMLIGTCLAVLTWIGIEVWKVWLPASDWIEIKELYVEDAQPGEDPRIVYDRVFKQDVAGTWTVNVYRHADEQDTLGTIFCSGFGTASYKGGRKLPPNSTRLSWLMGREENPCRLVNGTYRVTITIVITPEGYPSKVVEKNSNYFLVPPR